jgi:hypothetical protein
MYDIIDIIKLIETLNEDSNSLNVVKQFEKVLDELNIYIFKNWDEGELVKGPIISKYDVTCHFMWPKNNMPDPDGLKVLHNYGCTIKVGKNNLLIPRKITDPDDYRPGTKKGKIDAHPVWIISISMPKKLINDVSVGQENKNEIKVSELQKINMIQSAINNNQPDQGNIENDTQ